MAKLKKGNRIIEVRDDFVDGYLQRGYDQVDEKGKVVKEAKAGKTIPVSEYNKLKKELEELKAQGNNGVSQEEFDKLQDAYQKQAQELDEVKAKAKEFAEKGKKLQEENDRLKKQSKK